MSFLRHFKNVSDICQFLSFFVYRFLFCLAAILANDIVLIQLLTAMPGGVVLNDIGGIGMCRGQDPHFKSRLPLYSLSIEYKKVAPKLPYSSRSALSVHSIQPSFCTLKNYTQPVPKPRPKPDFCS